MEEKRIEVCTLNADELNTNFGNPRKINPKKKQEALFQKQRGLFDDSSWDYYLNSVKKK